MWQGELLHIHTSPAAGLNMESHKSASLIAGSGIEGDRYHRRTGKYSEIEDIREKIISLVRESIRKYLILSRKFSGNKKVEKICDEIDLALLDKKNLIKLRSKLK